MPIAIRMPKWGMIMEEGFLQSWLVDEGQSVQKGKGIAEIESDKATKELEAPASGVLARKLVKPGTTVPVGSLLGVIAVDDDSEELINKFIEMEAQTIGIEQNDNEPEIKTATKTEIDIKETSKSPEISDAPLGFEQGEGRSISPAALRFAKSKGVDWSYIKGTGPGGRIQISDVEASMNTSGIPIPLSRFRKAIASRTLLSIQAPQAALCRQIELTKFLEYRRLINQKIELEEARISLTAYLIPFIQKALQNNPELNCRLTSEGLIAYKEINLGIVVQSPDGIFVPVIKSINEKKLGILNAEFKELSEKASKNEIAVKDLEGGTFTFSNAGTFGIELFQPLLNPPEVAILGMGSIRKRPWVIGETVVPRDTAWFCLSTDHRAVDGKPAGKFLSELDEILQKPSVIFNNNYI